MFARAQAAVPEWKLTFVPTAWWKLSLTKYITGSKHQAHLIDQRITYDVSPSQDVLGVVYTDPATTLGATVRSMVEPQRGNAPLIKGKKAA